MLKKIVAAIILVCVSVGYTPAETQAGWEPRGRGRGRSRGRGRGWGYHRPDPGALGGIIGGVFGSWLWNQMNKDDKEDEREYKDEPPGDNR